MNVMQSHTRKEASTAECKAKHGRPASQLVSPAIQS